jgi:hypothetical protein
MSAPVCYIISGPVRLNEDSNRMEANVYGITLETRVKTHMSLSVVPVIFFVLTKI